MGKKRLSIIKPPIIGLHYHAYPLSALLSHKEYWPWFYSHYIQVYAKQDLSDLWGSPWFNFASWDIWNYGIPYISNTHMLDQRAVIENDIDVVTLIKNYIDREWYTYAEIDDYFIPFRDCYQKYRSPHDIFIYGYDDDSFEVAGFNYSRIFSFDKLKFSDFEKAFRENQATMCKVDFGGNNFLRIFKVLEEQSCEFDIKLVMDLISDYLNSVDTMEKFHMYRTPEQGRAYGLETYYYLKKYFKLLNEKKIHYDIRPIHLFWEHKSCMLLRLKYMCEHNIIRERKSICDDYRKIVNSAFRARDYLLKYEFTKSGNDLEKIIAILDNNENIERELLTLVLEELQKNKNKFHKTRYS